MSIQIRKAEPQDIPTILEFITELAIYEKLEHEVVTDKETLQKSLFGPTPFAEVLLLEENKKSAGIAIFFHNFSTFLGRPGIYLEDLFVKPEFRGKGYGKQLLAYLAQLTIERNCGRLEWSVLDWNTLALDFYKSVGATPMQEWTVQRLTGDSLTNLAKFANVD